MRLTEYEVREINADGDAVNVNHYATEAEAINDAERLAAVLPVDEAVAVVVEKHASTHPHTKPDRFETLATYGDPAALAAGGWTE